MKYQRVAYRQHSRIKQDLIGIIDNRIASDTPRFVTDNSAAMLAGRVADTVKLASRTIVGHW
jgi:ABC-type uncharacterized transport system fused permease/ATPase subunit